MLVIRCVASSDYRREKFSEGTHHELEQSLGSVREQALGKCSQVLLSARFEGLPINVGGGWTQLPIGIGYRCQRSASMCYMQKYVQAWSCGMLKYRTQCLAQM